MEVNGLVDRTVKVVLSCHTIEQLLVAQTYSRRVYALVGKSNVSVSEKLRSLGLIERSIGFAQGRIVGQ